MAGFPPVGAMPQNIPAPMHHTQAPQTRPSMPQQNGAPAGLPAFMPANTQPYSHPPDPPMYLRRQDPAEIKNARSGEPPMYRALRLEKTPGASSGGKARDTEYDWETITRTDKNMSQSRIKERIEHLDKTTRSVSKKKQDKNETIQLQLDRAQADLTKEDRDFRFYYKLAQIESEWRAADDPRHRDDRSVRSSRKHRSHSKRSKSPRLERVAINAYFQRMPADGRHSSRTLDTHGSMRQPRQIQQTPAQPRMGGLPSVTLPQGFVPPPPTAAPAVAAPVRPAPPPATDPRLNGQLRPPMGEQNVPRMPQAHSPRQGPFNNAQQSVMPPAEPGNAVPHNAVRPPPRLPAINIPIDRPPHGPLPGAKAPPQMPSSGPGAPKTPFEAGNRSPKKTAPESGFNIEEKVKVYHSSGRSSSPSDGDGDEWSEDESEDTRPSSIGSGSSPQRGRGRSPNPKRMPSDHHENIIIQDPRNLRKNAEYMADDRSSQHSDRQHVRFNSPGRRYRDESCSPRVEYHSPREQPWKGEPPRIIQAARLSVRHVRGTAPRRDDSHDIRPSRTDKPLERARLDDGHRERDVRRDNDRFKHIEEDLRRRREFKERREDRRPDDYNQYEATGPPPQRSQPRSQSFLPSSSPSTHNADIRQQLKKSNAPAVSARTMPQFSRPLQNRPSNMNQLSNNSRPPNGVGVGSLASLCGGSNSFGGQADVVDLTGPEAHAKAQAAVFFTEDDFCDDDDLDLDFQAPSALPPLPANTPSKRITKESMPPPPPTSTQTDKAIPWSSSPPSHFLPPPRNTSVTSTMANISMKRDSSGDRDDFDVPVPKKAKKRVLPQSFKQEEPEDEDDFHPQVAQTPNNKRKDFLNPTASAVKEQKKQFRTQRQQEQPTTSTDLSMDEIQEVTTSHSKGNFAISLSEEQRHVLDLVVNKNQSVFFTGAAGTGKSVLMRAIITELKKKYAKDPERVAVTASTGLAACNIGGITLHSFSGIGLGKEDAPTLVKKIRRNPKAKNRWLRTKCLVIDEISMVDGDLFDKLSQIGRTIRNNGRPWGGIQLIITGDFFQLPPVPEQGAKRETKFAFDASTWTTSIDHTIGLTQVFRQRDPVFANMLNEMRLGRITEDTVRAFKKLERPLNFNDGLGTAELFSTRNEVEMSNERRLRDLPGTIRRYEAQDTGKEDIRDKLLMNMMAPKSIDLKINAQVMLIKNLDESLVNGSLGKVIGFSDEKTFDMEPIDEFDEEERMAKARKKLLNTFKRESDSSSSGTKFPVVQFMATDGTSRVILCQPEEWKVELPNGELQAKRTQLPLILAWALSIHKAQGQTLERVKVNLGRVFEKGQAYVALSRATTQDGLQVLGFQKSKVMAHPRVIDFYNKLYSAEEALGKPKAQSITSFVSNRVGAAPSKAPAPKKSAHQVIDLDDEEEAMASFGY
ncbi:hypothetical protein AU210_010520 [Fusarium oxysporum f. sp. radicis-cucumerinum]|uniref:ATP-dependent DNA helicase PIF1 n=1 Tax=Fusarium oxysporum f. sp. radicis-cucumerinum TaxID=327505 RepID=A0A2H3H0F4_FUSOX|nr:hypothetical protein AU210_010520 [Fusarium oxysporum f. sp. radicis-cucumerinum]